VRGIKKLPPRWAAGGQAGTRGRVCRGMIETFAMDCSRRGGRADPTLAPQRHPPGGGLARAGICPGDGEWPASADTVSQGFGLKEPQPAADRACIAGVLTTPVTASSACFWWHLRCAAGGHGLDLSGRTPWTPGRAALASWARGRLRSGLEDLQGRWGFRAASPTALAKRWPQGRAAIDSP